MLVPKEVFISVTLNQSKEAKIKKEKWVLIVCLVIVSLFFMIPTTYASKDDGILRVGWTQEPRTLNPMGYDTIQGGMIMRSMLYDTLVAYDAKLKPAPMLAKSWQISDDGRVWTFDIVTGATWHDGQPLSSEDIAFTFQYILDNKIPNFINYLKNVEKVEAPDNTTVVLTYKEPIATTLWTYNFIINWKVFQGISDFSIRSAAFGTPA